MTPELQNRFERLDKFPLVSAHGDVLFTKKLAEQNGWTIQQGVQAIKEYRRFLFLAMEAGHRVSPSDAVDQVWHLHLMYTHEYWNVFCPEALGRPLHHHPSAGGELEREKFKDWYEATLASYRRMFDEGPLPEFWPPVERKGEMDQRIHLRVDTKEHWIIPKPRPMEDWRVKPAFAFLLVLLVLFLGTGCTDLGDDAPWSMKGPSFLRFFLVFLGGCWTVAYLVRQSRKLPLGRSGDVIPELSVYEIAFLGGGARRLMQALTAKLAAEKKIDIDENTKAVLRAGDSQEAEELERHILERVEGQKLRTLQEEVTPELEAHAERLKKLGLLVPDCVQRHLILVPFLIAALPLVVGGIKLAIGLAKDKPVGFLVFLLAVALIVALGFCRKAFRSKRGDLVLAALQRNNESVKVDLHQSVSVSQGAIVCLAVGLFGAEALAGTPYSFLKERLGPESGGGGCGSGCGGGGGGCGGGGCGGGCGGCG